MSSVVSAGASSVSATGFSAFAASFLGALPLPCFAIGTRIAMLQGGKFVEVATPDTFVKSSNAEVRKFLESQYITKEGGWERNLQ